MSPLSLAAKTRDITGRKVKKLRHEGFLPATLYGKALKSQNLSIALKEFAKVYRQAGQTGLVELKFDHQSQHTLIAHVQIHPVTRQFLHAEFHAVKLTEKIKTNVPVELVGESPAVQNNTGVLLQTLSEVEVEALPANLPEKLTVDIAKLSQVGQQVIVGDLDRPKGVEILTKAEEIVVKVAPAISQETKKELEAEQAAKAASEATKASTAVGDQGGGPAESGQAGPKKEPSKLEEGNKKQESSTKQSS